MRLPFQLLKQFRDIVNGKARLEISQIADFCPESLTLGRHPLNRQTSTQRLVNNFAKGPACLTRFRRELGRHIIIKGQSGSHVRDAKNSAS